MRHQNFHFNREDETEVSLPACVLYTRAVNSDSYSLCSPSIPRSLENRWHSRVFPVKTCVCIYAHPEVAFFKRVLFFILLSMKKGSDWTEGDATQPHSDNISGINNTHCYVSFTYHRFLSGVTAVIFFITWSSDLEKQQSYAIAWLLSYFSFASLIISVIWAVSDP